MGTLANIPAAVHPLEHNGVSSCINHTYCDGPEPVLSAAADCSLRNPGRLIKSVVEKESSGDRLNCGHGVGLSKFARAYVYAWRSVCALYLC